MTEYAIGIFFGNLAAVAATVAYWRGHDWQYWAFLSTFAMLGAAIALIRDIPN
ncbi:MAG: hypothetical protein ACRC14_09605 [Paracoccaceae bacterium]